MRKEEQTYAELWNKLSPDAQNLVKRLSKAKTTIPQDVLLALDPSINTEAAIKELLSFGALIESTFLSDIQYAAEHNDGNMSSEEAETQLALYAANPGIYTAWLTPRYAVESSFKGYVMQMS